MHQSENVMQCNCDSVPQTPFTRLTTQVEVPLSAACRSAAASFAPAGSWTTTAETCSWKGRAPNPLLLMLYDAIVYPRSLLQRAGQTSRKQWISRNDLLEISQYYKAPIARLLQFHTVPVSLPAVSLQVLLGCDRAAPAALAAPAPVDEQLLQLAPLDAESAAPQVSEVLTHSKTVNQANRGRSPWQAQNGAHPKKSSD